MAHIDQVAQGIYRIASFAPTSDMSFNQFLIEDRHPTCFHLLRHGFLCWTRPLSASLLLGTLADLARGQSERVAEMRPYENLSSSFVDRANDQYAPRGIEASSCFWQERLGPGDKRS